MKATTVILHYDAGNRILKGLLQLGQVLDACLNDLLAPLVHLVFLVSDVLVLLNNHLNGSLSYLLDFFRVEVLIVIHVIHIFES